MDFDNLTRCLVGRGRRVLRFDNYGRGWTQLPTDNAPMTAELFAGQIAEVLHALSESGAVDLVGYSLGGPIVTCYASNFGKSKVNSLTLLSPAGLPSMITPGLSFGQLLDSFMV